ncbi:hypothetical protein L211DRAFT_525347 [Terfezia boudieri ATCC MYA-4762]|uniref:Uncharacterized protein n=1 Tax=Terfezia boudieri ATCC MYA-4762 TaxID=1051890 RepID=A0A3N4LQV1_9PEZI|nr:hypothetical protein L211DRAFT_525347 [Terfezia boudieri ATCC MYA-4762]
MTISRMMPQISFTSKEVTICDHRLKKTRHPVRSAISKLQIARSVLWWVTMR